MIQEFFDEFYASTCENPFHKWERVWSYRVCFHLEESRLQPAVILRIIRTIERGAGWGSAGLQWLCELADKHEVTLAGCISATGTQRPRLDNRQLKTWYRRHGFTIEGNHMYRHPQLLVTSDNKTCRCTNAQA